MMRCYPEKYGNGVTILHIAGAKVLENTYRNATYNASRRCSIIDSLKDADVAILKPIEWENEFGDRPYYDPERQLRKGKLLYKPMMTIKNGKIVYRDMLF